MPLKLLSQVFGGGASSRLFMNLREDKGYTYGAYSSLKQSNYSGAFLVSTSVNNGVVSESLREIFREMEELKAREPGREELDRCKAEINGVFLRQMETPASICSMEVTRRLVGRPDGYYREFIPSLMAVRPGQVQAAARDLFDPEQAIVVVVGDRERIDLETA
jgi:predicted Zn-dependent peptidase